MKKYNITISGVIVEYEDGVKKAVGGFTGNITLEAEDAEKAISAVRNISLYERDEVRVELVELAEEE